MRYLFVFLLLFFLSISIYSQEKNKLLFEFNDQYYYYDKFENDINVSLRYIYPPPNKYSICFIDFSIGGYYGIIPKFYYIGIAGDAALGLDWLALFSDDDDNINRKNKNNNENKGAPQLGISLGGRIYNLFQIRNLRIWSFIGCDFFLIRFYPMPYVGAELSYKVIGLEYAYYLPINNDTLPRHRVSIKLHLPKDIF